MKPVAISGYEDDQRRLKRLAIAGAIMAVTVAIFWGTLRTPRSRT